MSLKFHSEEHENPKNTGERIRIEERRRLVGFSTLLFERFRRLQSRLVSRSRISNLKGHPASNCKLETFGLTVISVKYSSAFETRSSLNR